MAWVLVVDEEDLRGRWTLTEGSRVAGSGPDADLPLDHLTVSRRHAELTPAADGVWVADLGSSNGTRLDGTPITSRVLATAGQALVFGSLSCRLEDTADDELVPALEFSEEGAGGGSTEDARSGRDDKTLSVSSVSAFADALTEVVARLEGVLDGMSVPPSAALPVVQAAGRALYDVLPCTWLELVEAPLDSQTGDAAVLFRAGPDEPDTSHVSIQAGHLAARCRFAAGAHNDSFLPMVHLTTRLASIAWPVHPLEGSTDADRGSKNPTEAQEVRLPEPATVDPVLRRLYDDARRVARGDIGVLIEGESGTGKELLARFLHATSRRSSTEMVTLNCAALPRDLLEAELFGIEKGVATGVEARAGRFETADGGTLFLDEIGDMALETQAKILRVLQEGEVYRLGGRSPRKARVRVIAATHRNLKSMIDDSSFRLDLYHRIADCRFRLPPLRERLGDLPNLAAHFLTRAAQSQGTRPRGISKAALASLHAFPWPGNVRQLEREMSRAALFLEDGELLQNRHLQNEVRGQDPVGGTADAGDRSLKARLESYERGVIIETLARHDGQVRSAAEELDVGRTTLYRRLRELGIEP